MARKKKEVVQSEYDKRLEAAYRSLDRRIKDGTIKSNDYTSYIRGYMREESKY